MLYLVSAALVIAVVVVCSSLYATSCNTGRNIVIMLGAPGSGKGTQAKKIAEMEGIVHVSTGDLFRAHMRNQTALGKEVKAIIELGKLVSDEVVSKMLFERLEESDAKRGFLLDGYPRTLLQAEALEKKLCPKDRLIVIDLQVPDEVIVKRISGRASCKECGHIHNLYFSPSKLEGKCDKCGGELIQRADDRPEVVKERLRVYHKEAAPLVEYYRKKGVLQQVDGNREPEKITQDIKEIFKKS